eukprot:3938904-Rhodomonas_salina.2
MASAADASSPDLNAVLTKMQQQQQEISALQARLSEKENKLSEFTATKSKEMQGLLDGIFRYLDELGVSAASVDRFKESLSTAAQKG